jgi:5-methylcytosine-specific restriction endonuclease McrA
MNKKIALSVWERDNNICQNCGRELFETINIKELADKQLKEIKEIAIYKWQDKCWKCGKETPAVSYDICVLNNNEIGDVPKIDQKLSEIYNFVKISFSKTMQKNYFANNCIHCGILQGKNFISDRFIDLRCEEGHEKLIDRYLVNDLTLEDIDDDFEGVYVNKLPKIAAIHHIDKNKSNNKLENLILLCKDCYSKVNNKIKVKNILSHKNSQ